jgi:SAM-dependent methyltransferase
LVCTDDSCRREHPIVDGIPIVVTDLRAWAALWLDAVLRRDDLTPATVSLLADAAGPDSVLDVERRNLSTYLDAHYGSDRAFDGLLKVGLDLLPASPSGRWIDLGCGPGAGTIALAEGGVETVGVDSSFSFLQAAEKMSRTGQVTYDNRRVGLAFDRCTVTRPVDAEATRRAAFVCADVANLPFADASFSGALSLNVIDNTPDPVGHALEMGRALSRGGVALLASPFDWSTATTQYERWLGGHSQRGEDEGRSEHALGRLFGDQPIEGFDTGLTIGAETDGVPWRLRVHERAVMQYDCRILRLDKTG